MVSCCDENFMYFQLKPSQLPYIGNDESLRIIYIEAAAVHMQVNRQRHRCPSGSIFLINSHSEYKIERAETGALIHALLISPQFFDTMLRERLSSFPRLYDFFTHCAKSDNRRSAHQILWTDKPEMKLLIELMAYLSQPQQQKPSLEFFLALLSFLATEVESVFLFRDQLYPKDSKADRDILDIVTYIYDHYQSITLNELASRFNYTPTYLSSLIHQNTHMTFSEHLNQKRMEKARYLLQSTTQPIKQIIQRVGYHDNSAFYRQFKRSFGMTPSEYRRKTADEVPSSI